VVISSPATYRDVQQELIAEIHRTAIWPVVVIVDGNISKLDETDFIDRDGSYIILIPGGNVKSLNNKSIGLPIVRNDHTKFWNSEARFVVAGTTEFSMYQQTDIFDYLSNLRIYNCIIVNPEHFVIDKEYNGRIHINDVDRGMKLAVYTWFPYQSSDRCTEVNDITLLDIWVISAQGHFTKNIDLFPRKLRNNLNGCPMKASVRNGEWDLTTNYIEHTDSNGNVTEIEGMEMNLLQVVLQQMNMTFVLVPTIEDPINSNGKRTDDLFLAMIAKEVDILLGDVPFNLIFNSYFDCTNTYYMFSIRWYVPCFDKYPRWSSVYRILSVELWIVLIISIVIVAISTKLFARYSCTPEWHGYKTLTSSLTNLWAVVLGVSVSTMPRAPSLRSLFFAWLCFSVAFCTVFQAFLTTFLIDSGYKTPIQNMDELFASSMKLAYILEMSDIFENGDEFEASIVQKNSVICPSLDDCWEWATNHKNASILLDDDDAEERFALGSYLGENTKPLLCGLKDGVFRLSGETMIMLHGDPLMRRVTEIIDRVNAAGLYNYWNSLRMHSLKLGSRKIAIVHPLDGYYSFNLDHLQPAFYLLWIGWCLSALCFVVEILYNRALNKLN